MVLVDGIKYACQACIKGHRSSKCTHTDRELTEIKKKGRPTSQCNHCRELRKTRSVHGKCECVGTKEAREQTPVAKVLPNGLIDILKPTEVPNGPKNEVTKSGVTLLLNPCNCRSGGSCNCCQTVSKAKTKPFPETPSSPIFVASELPTPPLPFHASSSSGGCCSSARSRPAPPSAPAPPRASTSSCCSSRPAPSPPYFACNDIQVSSLPIPPPYTPPASNPLFLPQTHGTLSCFCGPTCQCVGCATHDPFALKAKRKRSDSMELEGGQSIGCQCEAPGPSSEAGDGQTRRKGKKKKECCSSSPASTPTFETTASKIDWPELNLSSASGVVPGGGTDSSIDPLPSLRTLLPALIDSTSTFPSASPPSHLPRADQQQHLHFDHLDPPSYISSDSPPLAEQPKIVCSSAFVKEIFDGDGECGERCLCDTECGCRKDPLDDGHAEEGGRERIESTGREAEMGDIARLAEMGHFG